MSEEKSALEVWLFMTTGSREGNEMSMMHGVVEHVNGQLTFLALDNSLSPTDIWAEMHRHIGNFDSVGVVWGIDRYAKPDQGIDKKSLVTVYHWRREHTDDLGFKLGVLPYDETGCDEQITWDQPFWLPIQKHELEMTFRATWAENERVLRNAGLPPELLTRLLDEIEKMKPAVPDQATLRQIFSRLADEALGKPRPVVH